MAKRRYSDEDEEMMERKRPEPDGDEDPNGEEPIDNPDEEEDEEQMEKSVVSYVEMPVEDMIEEIGKMIAPMILKALRSDEVMNALGETVQKAVSDNPTVQKLVKGTNGNRERLNDLLDQVDAFGEKVEYLQKSMGAAPAPATDPAPTSKEVTTDKSQVIQKATSVTPEPEAQAEKPATSDAPVLMEKAVFLLNKGIAVEGYSTAIATKIMNGKISPAEVETLRKGVTDAQASLSI